MQQAPGKTLANGAYYRSQLYTSYLGLNPLVTAAHPLFSIIQRVSLAKHALTLTELEKKTAHEVKAFESRAKTSEYDNETIMVAKFMLTTTLHSMLNGVCAQKRLTSQSSSVAHEKFLKIFNRIINKPYLYLDLLELIYLCFNSGYTAGFEDSNDPKLIALKDQLYETIIPFRAQKTDLKPKATPPVSKAVSSGHLDKKHKFLMVCATVFIVACTYLSTEALLNRKVHTLHTETISTFMDRDFSH